MVAKQDLSSTTRPGAVGPTGPEGGGWCWGGHLPGFASQPQGVFHAGLSARATEASRQRTGPATLLRLRSKRTPGICYDPD